MSKKLYPILQNFKWSDSLMLQGKTKWLGNHAVAAIERVYGTGYLGDPIEDVESAKNVDPINPQGGAIATSMTLLEEANAALEGGNGNAIRAALKKVYALQAEGETTYPTKEENTIALELWVEESQAVLTGKIDAGDVQVDAELGLGEEE